MVRFYFFFRKQSFLISELDTKEKLYKILLRFWPTWSHICVRFAGSMALTPINTMQCNDMQFKQRRLTTLPSSRSRYRYSTSTYIDPKKQQKSYSKPIHTNNKVTHNHSTGKMCHCMLASRIFVKIWMEAKLGEKNFGMERNSSIKYSRFLKQKLNIFSVYLDRDTP